MGHLRPLDHVDQHVLHVPEDAGPGEQVRALVHDGIAVEAPALLAHDRVIENVRRRPGVLGQVLDRLGVPERRMDVHVVAAVGRLEPLGADAPIILENAVFEGAEGRPDVARLQAADIDLEPPQQVLVARDLEMIHHGTVDVRLGLVHEGA